MQCGVYNKHVMGGSQWHNIKPRNALIHPVLNIYAPKFGNYCILGMSQCKEIDHLAW